MQMKNIVLIGMLGSGKTTFGTILSKKYHYQFIDSDEEIEKNIQTTIS
jgi:shikimate kinase